MNEWRVIEKGVTTSGPAFLLGFTAGTGDVWAPWKDHIAVKFGKPFYRSNWDTPFFRGPGWCWLNKDQQFKKSALRYLVEGLKVTITEKKTYTGVIT